MADYPSTVTYAPGRGEQLSSTDMLRYINSMLNGVLTLPEQKANVTEPFMYTGTGEDSVAHRDRTPIAGTSGQALPAAEMNADTVAFIKDMLDNHLVDKAPYASALGVIRSQIDSLSEGGEPRALLEQMKPLLQEQVQKPQYSFTRPEGLGGKTVVPTLAEPTAGASLAAEELLENKMASVTFGAEGSWELSNNGKEFVGTITLTESPHPHTHLFDVLIKEESLLREIGKLKAAGLDVKAVREEDESQRTIEDEVFPLPAKGAPPKEIVYEVTMPADYERLAKAFGGTEFPVKRMEEQDCVVPQDLIDAAMKKAGLQR